MFDELVSTDLKEAPDTLFSGERYVQADLADYQAMADIIDGADMVVHLAAIQMNIRLKISCIQISLVAII